MIYFEEVQRPPKAMNIVLYIAMTMVTLAAALNVFLSFELGSDASWVEHVVPALLLLLIPISIMVLFRRSRQTVIINDTEIRVRQSPFHRKDRVFPWTDVTTAIYRPMSPMGEFGGWGIRYNMNGAWGYVLGGDRGIELHLANGKKRIVSIVDGQGARAALEAVHTQQGVNIRFLTQR